MPERNALSAPVQVTRWQHRTRELSGPTPSEANQAGTSARVHRDARAPIALWEGTPTAVSVEHDAIYDDSELTDTRNDPYHSRERTDA